ncbi:hypothetical protein [Carboxydothermus hydrogenoformans]|uniref:Uncharacterized protein n=1 Tax=Carboxydothermus hydrogenoformans (strain ATCC BAA-161 / DSM 6008 / Z-2901) TaxID=246194 RepID=Q3A9J1_CARHZ|nr:hypothetical protein [Carboxydothermus hydrogenoformans]ABB15601.1 hypothetical protein CHY_2396 [Carboxydothermus hydrogenoformans Z-2901]
MDYDDRVHNLMDSFKQGLINRESTVHMLSEYYGNEMADEILKNYFQSWENFIKMEE